MINLLLFALLLVPQAIVTPVAHSATVNWKPSPDAIDSSGAAALIPGSSYGIYRAPGVCNPTISGFVKLSAMPTNTAAYTDTTVTPGSWCYTVRLLLNGAESVNGNLATASIPVSAPSGVTVTVNVTISVAVP